jgi:type I restriction enzyme, S subunit
MNRYPAYKPSGIDWLGEIPAHWKTSRLKNIASINAKTLTESTEPDFELEYVDISNVTIHGLQEAPQKMRFEDSPSRARRIVQSEDTIISTVRTYLQAVAYFDDAPENLIASTGFAVLTPQKGIFPKFLYNLVRSPAFINAVTANSVGVSYPAINSSVLSCLPVWLPAIEEQQAIVAFLDEQTAVLDNLISEKQALIGLLQEKRAAVISRAVTQGLDTAVALKDSGVDWLGTIPAHWQKIDIKYLLHAIIDTEHKTVTFYPDGEYLVVRTSNVRHGKLVMENAKYTDYEGFREWTRRGIPHPGDILFTREAPAGEACVVPSELPLCMGQRMVLFRVNHDLLDSNFAVYSIYAGVADEFITALSQGSTVAHFNMSDIGNIPILTPPIEEQRQIAEYLDRKTTELDTLIAETEASIATLQEYRTALIASAVTGQIDVRPPTHPYPPVGAGQAGHDPRHHQ